VLRKHSLTTSRAGCDLPSEEENSPIDADETKARLLFFNKQFTKYSHLKFIHHKQFFNLSLAARQVFLIDAAADRAPRLSFFESAFSAVFGVFLRSCKTGPSSFIDVAASSDDSFPIDAPSSSCATCTLAADRAINSVLMTFSAIGLAPACPSDCVSQSASSDRALSVSRRIRAKTKSSAYQTLPHSMVNAMAR
jgi:hypothetical protein